MHGGDFDTRCRRSACNVAWMSSATMPSVLMAGPIAEWPSGTGQGTISKEKAASANTCWCGEWRGESTGSTRSRKTAMKQTIAGLVLFLVASCVSAAPIFYNVNRFQLGPVTLVGTIETDGTIGVIHAENVVSWSFVLGNPLNGVEETLSSSTGVLTIEGSRLIARSTDLQFVFDDPFHVGRNVVQFLGPVGQFLAPYWAFASGALAGGAGVETVQSNFAEDFRFAPGPEFIAFAAPAAVVPEPTSLPLIAAGLMLGFAARRRARSACSAEARSGSVGTDEPEAT